jgi:diguanylate cyclase (GGDEF)-like protein
MDDSAIPQPIGWQDAVTGIDGPDFWQRVLVAEVARTAKYARPLTVVIVELEGIEQLAAEMGDAVARHAIHEAGQFLRRISRPSDYCTRIDTDRFGVMLTETNEIVAINFVERVRADLPAVLPQGGAGLRLSFGWASPIKGDSAAALSLRAEERLVRELSR